MAKRKEQTAQIGDNSDHDVDFDVLSKFLKDVADKAKAVSSKNGELRSFIKSYLDNTGLHPQAVAMIRTIENMDQTKRNDFLRSFEPMMELMVMKVWRDAQTDIFTDNTKTE